VVSTAYASEEESFESFSQSQFFSK